MDQETLMERLRNPQKFQKKAAVSEKRTPQQSVAVATPKNNRVPALIGGAVFILLLISLLFLFSAQKKAANITDSLDPAVLKGLIVDKTFSAHAEKRYVQISAGRERNVSVKESGSALPVISRDNYRALTPENYALIGEAPFALSLNVSSNVDDPQLLRYLFSKDETVQAFLKRADVAALLEDPAALAALAQNEAVLKAFFAEDAVQNALASEQLVMALSGSRLFSYLIISKAVKYYRDRPNEMIKLIQNSPTLFALKQNPNVRKAVQENKYLKNIAPTLLK